MSNIPIKENFCGACLALPLALAGAGAGAAGMQEKGEQTKKKERLIQIGLVSLGISVALLVYFLVIKKCKGCR